MFKHLITSLLFILTVGFSFSQEFEFEEESIKYDAVKEGAQLSFNYIFTNTGQKPLIIHSSEVACTCTDVSLPEKPVPPRKKDTVKISFDTNLKLGWQQREVILYSNAGKQILEFRGEVKATEATKKKYREQKKEKK